MLTPAQIEGFRTQLETLRDGLAHQSSQSQDARGTVTLDQQSVGRLSRMDAMQQQAMALATETRRKAQAKRIAEAFARMDDGEFGYCIECGEDIAPKRLELDPTLPTCITCASG